MVGVERGDSADVVSVFTLSLGPAADSTCRDGSWIHPFFLIFFSSHSEELKNVIGPFRILSEAFRNVPEAFKKVPEVFRNVPESFRNPLQSFRNLLQSFRNGLQCFRNVPAEETLEWAPPTLASHVPPQPVCTHLLANLKLIHVNTTITAKSSQAMALARPMWK